MALIRLRKVAKGINVRITIQVLPPTGERGPYWQALLHTTAPHRTRRKPWILRQILYLYHYAPASLE